jgi:hypothetical protein
MGDWPGPGPEGKCHYSDRARGPESQLPVPSNGCYQWTVEKCFPDVTFRSHLVFFGPFDNFDSLSLAGTVGWVGLALVR